jgi:hypothetical protein
MVFEDASRAVHLEAGSRAAKIASRAKRPRSRIASTSELDVTLPKEVQRDRK